MAEASGAAERGAERGDSSGARPVGIGTTLAFAGSLVLLAVLLTTSAQSPPPADARIGQRVELVELIQAEEARAAALQRQVEELAADLAALEDDITAETAETAAMREQLEELAVPAGLTPVRGPGISVILRDASMSVPADGDPNDYVIHEEDLQAVINALWASGAEAVAVNGHRIVATTAIRCVGNVLLLHGNTYSPPYEIVAIGDDAELVAGLQRDEAVQRFARAVRDYKLGFDVERADEALTLPAYEGSLATQVATPSEPARG